MISTCKAYLVEKLKKTGIPAQRIFNSPDALDQQRLSPYAVVWAPDDQQPLRRCNLRVGVERVSKELPGIGLRTFNRYRVKMWAWVIVINVMLVKKQATTVDTTVDDIFYDFVSDLSGFTDVGGNYIDLSVGFAERPDDRAALRTDQEICLSVQFSSGIYKDEDVLTVGDSKLIVEPSTEEE